MAWTDLYVRADAAGSGDGTTNTNSGANGAFTLAEAITHSTTNTGVRYNIYQGGGTFANTTTTLTFSGAGTATAANWWRGFNTTIGDCDDSRSLTKPSITFTTGQFAVSGANQKFSSLDISSQCVTAGGAVNITAATVELRNLRINNTAANAAARALTYNTGSSYGFVTGCYFQATSSANLIQLSAVAFFNGCYFKGGLLGISSSQTTTLTRCIIDGPASHGISTTQPAILNNCTFYGAAVASIDAVRITSVNGSTLIANCIFSEWGGYGINQSSGANANIVVAQNCGYYNCTSGQTNGITESYQIGAISLSGDPFVAKGSGDFRLSGNGAGAKDAGYPGTFENASSSVGYLSLGAVAPGSNFTINVSSPLIRSALRASPY